MKVSFVLESGFESDTGALDTKQRGRLFGRESNVTVSGGFGDVTFGLIPIFGSVLGANGLFRAPRPGDRQLHGWALARASPRPSFDDPASTTRFRTRRRPSRASRATRCIPFKVNGKDGAGQEGDGSTDRYAFLAVRYQQGPLEPCSSLTRPATATTSIRPRRRLLRSLPAATTLDNGLAHRLRSVVRLDDPQHRRARRRGADGIMATTSLDPNSTTDAHRATARSTATASFGVNFRSRAASPRRARQLHRDMNQIHGQLDFTRWMVAGGFTTIRSRSAPPSTRDGRLLAGKG